MFHKPTDRYLVRDGLQSNEEGPVLTEVVLALGALVVPGFVVRRSGIRWLVADGTLCRARQVVGFCNIVLEGLPGARRGSAFGEGTEWQVGLAMPAPGRLRINRETSFGGYLDTRVATLWDGGLTVGLLAPDAEGDAAAAAVMLHLMLAGTPMTGLAHDGRGLLRGWNAVARAWWDTPGGVRRALLALGVCDVQGPVAGDEGAFLEMFEEAAFPGHVVMVPYKIVAPCVTFLREQFLRTAAAFEAIAEDLRAGVFGGTVAPAAADYLFVGTLLNMLGESPIRQLARLKGVGPPVILLSSGVEPMQIRRHKRLGYHLNVFRFQLDAAGPAARAWLQTAFEVETLGVAAAERDYLAFFETVRAAIPARFIVVNRMSTSGREDLSSYAAFDAPLGRSLVHVAAKEMNVMLDGLAGGDVAVADADALVAELGGARHLPDGVHQSGEMQRRMRAEILRLMG